MFANLPQPIQQQILYYLEANNFRAAKELRDQALADAVQPEDEVSTC